MLAIKGIYDGNNIIPIENITSDGNEIKNEFIRAVRIFDLTGRGKACRAVTCLVEND
ncbi:MAG: hypothetical protein K8R37_11845 [Bacteroidales bacterium]|nr:hypothetical protein [Bacteroidales bacterium]